MGDGGVACMPLHQSIMDRLSIPEKAHCGAGVNNGKNGFNNSSSSPSSSVKLPESGTKKKMKKVKRIVKRVVTVKKKGVLKSEVAALETKEKINGNKVDKKGDGSGVDDKVVAQNDEVEEGELGTLKWPTREVENGELLVPEKPKRGGGRALYEKGEINVERWRKGDSEKEYAHGNWRRGEVEKGEFRSWRGYSDEVERGEFIPDRWHRGEVSRDDYSGYSKSSRRYEQGKDKGWKHEFERSPPWRTPPSGRFQDDEGYFRKKEFSKNVGHHSKNPFSRWEGGLERILPRLGPKVTNEDGSHRGEFSNGKNQFREHFSANRLKRHSYEADSDSSERGDRKQYSDYADYASSKSRRLSDEGNHSFHSEHYSHRSGERHYNNSSSRDKLSSRQHEYSLPSRGAYDRHGRSPVSSDRSPHGRSRHYEHRDRSPRHERSPYSRERSPYVHGRIPYSRDRSPYGRGRSPHVRDGTPFGRDGTPYSRERSPYCRDRSPYERNYRYDYRNKSPTYADRSTQERGHSDRRDQNQNNVEQSPHEQGKPQDRETSRKSDSGKISSQPRNRVEEEKPKQKEQSGKEMKVSVSEAQERSNDLDVVTPAIVEKDTSSQSQKEDQSQTQTANCNESPHVDMPVPEEMLSMEEDMDISDTPPHVPVVADAMRGRWVYLDYVGVERGPSKLCDLKALVDDGVLAPDHFIKHLDTDRWVTVQNAASPLVTLNFTSIASDDITQLVTPPEAPGNLSEDITDANQSGVELIEEIQDIPGLETVGDFFIDKRVAALLEGVHSVEGKELEAVGEALQMTFENEQWEKCQDVEDFIWHQACSSEHFSVIKDEISTCPSTELREGVNFDREISFNNSEFGEWSNGQLSCKGGDWKRNEETALDRFSRKKLVLNDGFPLCQMTKLGYEDPRWHEKDELYQPSLSKRLDLPPWAYSLQDERIDVDGVGRTQVKPAITRAVKGTVLSVVRINACVVRDNGSFVSENRKVWGKDRHSSRSARPYSSSSDVKRSTEGSSRSRTADEHNLHNLRKSAVVLNIPKDRVCTVNDLQLHLGDWYFVDGAGHERGPLSFSELQVLADQSIIPNHSSVFRKLDRLWIPISSAGETSKVADNIHVENNSSSTCSAGPQPKHTQVAPLAESSSSDSYFHSTHPQFIGFMRGKLHELVMRSYKSREFAAAINEVLDPWITSRQPKKDMEKLTYRKSDFDFRAGKRLRLSVDESEEDSERDEDLQNIKRNEASFEDLCGSATFSDHSGSSGLLDGHMLARVFHFLRSDLKTLAAASITCKQWRAAVRFYKDISREIDVSSLGPNCTDTVLRSIMSGYDKERINALILKDCSSITSDMLEEILRMFPCLSYIDIRGCSQFGDLSCKYSNISWIRSRNTSGDARPKNRTLKQLSEKNSAWSATKGVGRNDTDDFSELKDYFDSVDRRDAAGQAFHRGFYKRSKLFDARKASSILSRDARVRRWTIMNSEKGYKRMEEFLVSSLKEIMRENTFDFFVPKVAEIQDRLKNGYYIRRGIRSVKEDIGRICRDAIKAKNRGEAGDMNHIVTLFIQLASQLEESSKSSFLRDGIKSWKDDSSSGIYTSSRNKKKLVKADNDRKYRSNGSSFSSGGYDDGDYTSDQEIRRRLSKLNKKSLDSESETSDDTGGSFEYSKSDSETTVSETESDSELRSQAGDSRANSFASIDEGLDSFTDDREWGARMTKASLVPPVTRKYEVIDEYVILADEDEVRRRMQVSLPEDYAEKLDAQKNGAEELDMELPEVKDYKPRKKLGVEVIEQEVYGIDPYTHNLLLDSMPEELDWSLADKHLFIEDALLCTLNKQVRHFTGTVNTPMMYPLQPVIEEIERAAEEDHDMQTVLMCQGILRAIASRPEDKYVAYRKGLGVVCNKEGGFGEEDFVVEFLGEVYPTWKWFEKQDGIRSLQKNNKEPAPEFYNIYLERPKGDADGYDLVVVDAMHKANYASRICHSCRPNCEAKVTAVDGQYQIGIYSTRKIQFHEEITFDYNSVTESKEEYEASVCLCGSQVCRGSYLNLTGEGAFQKILKEWHGLLDRHQLMLEACELNSVSEEDYYDLGRAGLGSCLLGGLPDWLIAYSARLVRFINIERTKLPEEILRYNLEEKRKYFLEISLDVEKSDAEVQAEGVYNQRLQNLAITLDKVRYVMRCVFGDPKQAPPPLVRLSPKEVVSFLWKGEGSVVEELLECIAPHMDDDTLSKLKSNIRDHDPSNSENVRKELKKSLLWLRDEIRYLPCTHKCRHDAAADLIHVYAYTKHFFRIQAYETVTSPPVYISQLDLGPKTSEKLGAGLHEYCKTYGENYCLGQLIFWHIQTYSEPDNTLFRASRGCLSLPDIGSFYAKFQKPSRQRVYGPRTVRSMLARMEKQPQRPWPKDQIWSFKSGPKVFGSPMLDAVLNNSSLDREMVNWLKNRPTVFHAMWDQ